MNSITGHVVSVISISIICPIWANYSGQLVMMKGEQITLSCSSWSADQWRHTD